MSSLIYEGFLWLTVSFTSRYLFTMYHFHNFEKQNFSNSFIFPKDILEGLEGFYWKWNGLKFSHWNIYVKCFRILLHWQKQSQFFTKIQLPKEHDPILYWQKFSICFDFNKSIPIYSKLYILPENQPVLKFLLPQLSVHMIHKYFKNCQVYLLQLERKNIINQNQIN